MEVLSSCDAFKRLDGRFQFSYVEIIVRYHGEIYRARCHGRGKVPTTMAELHDIHRVETEDRGPVMKEHWTLVREQQCCWCIKMPNLQTLARSPNLDEQLSCEVEACEAVRRHPHPNLASYHGCTVVRGRVTGLCFSRYVQTLAERVDPEHLNKAAFISSGRHRVDRSIIAAMPGVLRGIHHLHSLRLVHNDIKPANIMFDASGIAVLIDFDSCRRAGQPLGQVGRTRGWFDGTVETASFENDIGAYQEIMTWLTGTSVDSFLYEG